MHDIEQRILVAQKDKTELNELLKDYLPYIKKQLIGMSTTGLEYDDMLSLSMLTFMNAVKQYRPNHGNFLSFCAICIKHRLIDEGRKQKKYMAKQTFFTLQQEDRQNEIELEEASISVYNKHLEQEELAYEIKSFSKQVEDFGFSFADLPRICPKQQRARLQCYAIANAIKNTPNMRENLLNHHKLGQSELAEKFSISTKTVEKHRRYIVALALLLIGDYPCIRAYLPQIGEAR